MCRTILIGADIVPTESNYELFKTGNRKGLIGETLSDLLDAADFRMFNLEVPLTGEWCPINKCGPNLIAPIDTINGYKALDIDVLTLANNHILDQGGAGLYSTVQILNNVGISYFGAGKNLEEARKPFVFEFSGKKIGVYGCAEHEFTIANDKDAGANPFDIIYSFDHIADLKKSTDYVIVLYHGGKEHYRYPSPNLQKVCRRFIESGADLVVCQHSHCIGCEEKWKTGTIVYGQGNFLFDYSDKQEWQTSILIQIDEELHISYVPLVKNNETVRCAAGGIKDNILSDFYKRSEEILQKDFVENTYKMFAEKMLDDYLFACYGHKNLLFRVINIITKRNFYHFFLKRQYKIQNILSLTNYIECEAHRELFLAGLKNSRRME